MVLKQNVGIDVSMDTLDVNFTLLDENFNKQCIGKKKFNNNAEGFVKLLDWVFFTDFLGALSFRGKKN